MLVHIGDKKKIFIFEPATLAEVVLSTRPGPFRTPQWLPMQAPNGDELCMFVEDSEGGEHHLVLAEARVNGRRRVVAETRGFTSFTVSPDGQRCAILCGADRAQDGDFLSIVEVGFHTSPLLFNPLSSMIHHFFVYDLPLSL